MLKTGKNVKLVHFQFLLSLFVVLIHNHTSDYYDYNSQLLNDIGHYIITVIVPRFTNIAVPCFFVISGYLFYRHYSIDKTGQVMKKKVRTLLIPYLIWNLVYYLIQVVFYYSPIRQFQQFDSNPLTVTDFLLGVFFHKYNAFWFIEALMIYNVLCVPLYYILRNRKPAVLFLIIVTGLTGFLRIKESPLGTHYELTSLAYYAFGSFLGIHYKDLVDHKFSRKQSGAATLLLIASVIGEMLANEYFPSSMQSLLSALTAYNLVFKSCLLWIIFNNYGFGRDKWYFKLSFFIYAMHNIVGKVCFTSIRLAFNRILPVPLREICAYSLSAVLTVWIIILVAKIWEKYFRKSFLIVTGGR